MPCGETKKICVVTSFCLPLPFQIPHYGLVLMVLLQSSIIRAVSLLTPELESLQITKTENTVAKLTHFLPKYNVAHK